MSVNKDFERISLLREAAASGKRLKAGDLTLLRAYVGHKDWALRCEALEALIEVQSPSDSLRVLLATYDPNWSVRCEAIEALPAFLGARSKRRLIELCNGEPNPINRGIAIQSLATAIGRESLSLLHDIARKRLADQTRLRLFDALVRLGEKDKLAEMMGFLGSNERLSRELCLNLLLYQMEDGIISKGDLLDFHLRPKAFMETEQLDRLTEKAQRLLDAA